MEYILSQLCLNVNFFAIIQIELIVFLRNFHGFPSKSLMSVIALHNFAVRGQKDVLREVGLLKDVCKNERQSNIWCCAI